MRGCVFLERDFGKKGSTTRLHEIMSLFINSIIEAIHRLIPYFAHRFCSTDKLMFPSLQEMGGVWARCQNTDARIPTAWEPQY